jgi:hypothetical protein
VNGACLTIQVSLQKPSRPSNPKLLQMTFG